MMFHARSRRRNHGAKFFDGLRRSSLEQRWCASGQKRQRPSRLVRWDSNRAAHAEFAAVEATSFAAATRAARQGNALLRQLRRPVFAAAAVDRSVGKVAANRVNNARAEFACAVEVAVAPAALGEPVAQAEPVAQEEPAAPGEGHPVLRDWHFAAARVAQPEVACQITPVAATASRFAPVSAARRTNNAAGTIAVNVAESAAAPVAVHGESNVLMASALSRPLRAVGASPHAHLVV